jgi:hypothetical protein
MFEKATLVKFGKYDNICQLREEGLLYMNNLPYFWQIEDENLRGDKFDSVVQALKGKSGIMVDENKPEDIFTISNWEIRELPKHPELINVFCMCAVRPSFGTFPVDKRNHQFGEYALVFVNPQEFTNRISTQLQSQHISHKANLVEYISNYPEGKIGPFKKREKYNYQSEWRLICFNGPGKERRVNVGSIQDICKIVTSDELDQTLLDLLNINPS